ncbi:cupin domain-containing protein [Micromonospora sp. RTGN7]|uniref:cupin domain-containing protein n=1 Tax=Micromonospora sp. RTGN7 TaxID=3016526 RepID=UPI0029FEDC3C|nr:cupin domain-containing protein [Micromonospora sp. RTGN7]
MSETVKAPATAPVVAAAEVAANRRRGGDIRVVLSPKTVGSTSGFMGTLTLRPGEYVTEHYHPYSEEFVFVVEGTLVARVEEVGVFEVSAGAGFMVPIGARHRVWNDSDTEVRAVFHLAPLAPRPELGHVDTEQLPAGGEGMSQPDVGAPRR